MTPSERDKQYRQAQNGVLRARTALQKDTHAEVMRLLQVALADVKAALAAAPSDFQSWYLPQLQAEIERTLAVMGRQSAVVLGSAVESSWGLGVDFLDKPLAAGGLSLAGLMPSLSADQLLIAMKNFHTERIKDVGVQALGRINSELGLTVIGSRPMGDTIGRVQTLLGGASRERATTIVRTSLGQAFSTAADRRSAQAVAAGVEMDKIWRRSGKLHPRVSHALADGQRKPVEAPFLVGGVALMHPHDPAAPAKDTINCGCIALYVPRGWSRTLPDHKPFTDTELALNPRLADAVEARGAKPIRQ